MQDKCNVCSRVDEIALDLEIPAWEKNEKGEEEYHPTRWLICFPCYQFDNAAVIR